MKTEQILLIFVIPTILNIVMVIHLTRKDKFLNPMSIFACLLAFIGTLILGIITL